MGYMERYTERRNLPHQARKVAGKMVRFVTYLATMLAIAFAIEGGVQLWYWWEWVRCC